MKNWFSGHAERQSPCIKMCVALAINGLAQLEEDFFCQRNSHKMDYWRTQGDEKAHVPIQCRQQMEMGINWNWIKINVVTTKSPVAKWASRA